MDDTTIASRAKPGEIAEKPPSEDVLSTYVAEIDEVDQAYLIEWSGTEWIKAGSDSYTPIQQ